MTKILYTNKFSRLALAFFLFLNISLSVSAQSLDEARQMIKDGNYEAAREAFSELIKKNANRADVNKWYGESLYETGYYQEAEKYLKNAANKRIQGAYLYLGKLYQKTYKFKLAVQNLEKYQTFLKKDPEELERVDSLILECQLAEKALTRIEKV